jgi:hypothetical protein
MKLIFISVVYVVLYIYSIIMAWRGIEFFNYLTDTDSPLQKKRLLREWLTVPVSLVILASLIMEELIKRKPSNGVLVDAGYDYADCLVVSWFTVINAFFFGIFRAFGLEPASSFKVLAEPSLASLLFFSLDFYGSACLFGLLVIFLRIRAAHKI